MNEHVIALIPIRGTDRLYSRLLAGKTLLGHTIDAVKESSRISKAVVVTDNKEIAAAAQKLGASSFLQDAALSAKGVKLEDVLKNALAHLEQQGTRATIVFSLEITHPVRPHGLFDKMIALMETQDIDTALTVVKEKDSFWRIADDGSVSRLDETSRREERKPIFREMLGVACATRADLIRQGVRVGKNVGIVPIDGVAAHIDITSEDDFWLAEQLMRHAKV